MRGVVSRGGTAVLPGCGCRRVEANLHYFGHFVHPAICRVKIGREGARGGSLRLRRVGAAGGIRSALCGVQRTPRGLAPADLILGRGGVEHVPSSADIQL